MNYEHERPIGLQHRGTTVELATSAVVSTEDGFAV